MSVSTEEFLAKYVAGFSGRIDALAHLCVSLLVTRPDERVLLAVSKLGEKVRAELSAAEQTSPDHAYFEGMMQIVEHVEVGLKTAAQAVQIAGLKPEGGH